MHGYRAGNVQLYGKLNIKPEVKFLINNLVGKKKTISFSKLQSLDKNAKICFNSKKVNHIIQYYLFEVLFLLQTFSLWSLHFTMKYAFSVMLKSLSLTFGMSLMSTPGKKI